MNTKNLLQLAYLVGLVLLPALAAFGGHEQDTSTNDDTQYLLFQIFTAGPGFTTESGKHVLSELPSRDFLEGEAQDILDAIGEHADDKHKMGVSIGPLALDHTDAQLRALVEWTFAIALEKKIAVALHIDDSKFWSNRSDLWRDARNVEWLDWNGTANGGQYLNWGEPWKLAPQACFNSPALIKEVKRIGAEVIGPAISEQISKLRAKGLEDLFAGVIVGWETAIGRDFDSGKSLGYCALANRGYTKANPPRDRDSELEAVVSEWVSVWSKSIESAGVPADRIYSHVAFISRKQYESDHGSVPGDTTYSQSVMYSPPEVAFGTTHRPGFSVYAEPRIIGDVYAALEANGKPPWGVSEGTNVDIYRGRPTIGEEGMESYLAHMFNYGATMTNLFGWGVGNRSNPFRRATEGDEAIAAYRKFLSGDRLDEKPLSDSKTSDSQTELQNRLRALPARIDAYQKSGGNMSRIQPRVAKIEGYIKSGRYDDLESELDSIDNILGSSSKAPVTGGKPEQFDVAKLKSQMQALPQKIDAYQKQGGDMSVVAPRVEQIQKHLRAGKPKEAYDELQDLLPILEQ